MSTAATVTAATAPTAATTADGYVTAELYTQVQQFYARQMGLLDDGDPDAWTTTFTEDAVFAEASRLNEPLRGRDAIRASSRARQQRLDAEGIDFRHWLGMLDVRPQPDGSLRTRAYALAMRTPRGGTLDIFASVVCHDHLVRGDDGLWRVAHRDLTHDGAARESGAEESA
ncbi:nuclear transport factor 2 family protein [Streptomyces sp. TRM 70351]|uniref:nuclear transport factor 2 family protein n=1 Tax=Streptomyces sp. TRM 70351 TaxID=3116552 RepID=UPI002E7ADF43|nr:nuclear transport factor 2 family protein [Streptomyces sp. TRM 70351]MEE1929388.1 nuclear transport factor 2 family protein [Streptomyces sp. TRM 70351]